MNQHATNSTAGLVSEKGAAMVEFVLVLPIFLLLLLGMFDFGKLFNYWIDGTHLSHEGARYAAVSKWPGGGQLADSIKARADTAELRAGGTSVSGPVKVCVSFPSGSSKVGEPVRVSVEFTYKFLGYVNSVYPSLTSKTVSNTSTMRIERPPTFSTHCSA